MLASRCRIVRIRQLKQAPFFVIAVLTLRSKMELMVVPQRAAAKVTYCPSTGECLQAKHPFLLVSIKADMLQLFSAIFVWEELFE